MRHMVSSLLLNGSCLRMREPREVRPLTQGCKIKNPSSSQPASRTWLYLPPWDKSGWPTLPRRSLWCPTEDWLEAQSDVDPGQHYTFQSPLAPNTCCPLVRLGPGPGLGDTFRWSSLVPASSWARWSGSLPGYSSVHSQSDHCPGNTLLSICYQSRTTCQH